MVPSAPARLPETYRPVVTTPCCPPGRSGKCLVLVRKMGDDILSCDEGGWRSRLPAGKMCRLWIRKPLAAERNATKKDTSAAHGTEISAVPPKLRPIRKRHSAPLTRDTPPLVATVLRGGKQPALHRTHFSKQRPSLGERQEFFPFQAFTIYTFIYYRYRLTVCQAQSCCGKRQRVSVANTGCQGRDMRRLRQEQPPAK